jgi:hypothetical protein
VILKSEAVLAVQTTLKGDQRVAALRIGLSRALAKP